MEENKKILSFQDVKNSEIEIFENKFEINFSEKYINRLKSLDIKKVEEEETFNALKEMLNLVLNDNEAYNKIATSYKNHENKEFGTQVFIKVMTFIFNEYSKEINSIKGIDFGSKNLYANREQRRDNRDNRNNGYRKNNYRGYNSRRY